MSRICYPCRFRLSNGNRYLIWYTEEPCREEPDGVVIDARGAVPVFRTLADLATYADACALAPLSDETPVLHSLDVVRRWLRRKCNRTPPLDCVAFLAAWNLFADVSRSVVGDFDLDKKRTQTIYDKLFGGNNLPAVTPPGKRCVPIWTCAEQRVIREVMGEGMRLFRRHAPLAATSE